VVAGPEGWTTPDPRTSEDPRHRPGATSDPVLRHRLPSLVNDLVDYAVVERSASGWLLSVEVQGMLEELHRVRSADHRRMIVGRPCQGCGQRTLTFRVGNRRLCRLCTDENDVAKDP
jgi:hypothetical protein